MTRVLRVDPRAPDPTAIAEASRVLGEGGLVGLPTETVYGLAADAFDPRAIARVFAAKGRPANHPLIAHVSDEAQARTLAGRWSNHAARLASAFWPGPLTLVVERARHVPSALTGGGSSVAVRAPSHAVARAVIEALGRPVAAPSANRFQGLSATTAAHVTKSLGDAVDLVLDAGPCEGGIESTVVDTRGDIVRVLRLGALSVCALAALVGHVEASSAVPSPEQGRASPGMDRRHYAPRARLILSPTRDEALRLARSSAEAGVRVAVLARDGGAAAERDAVAGHAPGALLRWLPDDPAAYARHLYSALHDLDDAGVSVIVVEDVPAGEPWSAIADRLRRGSAT
ncbi:MAG: L-threonylcarbamoyladenylate synthase [Myxococcota bacterium]|nr:L-threonylcarbamoyladenylate synthase [Myxococcota bacterium]